MVSSSNSNNINNNSAQTEEIITEEEIDAILNRPTTTQSESNEIIENDENDIFNDLILNRRFNITSQLDEYKKEYNYIIKINKQFKKLLNRLDDIDNGLFNSELAFKICKLIKKFLRRQEKGKFKDISDFEIYEEDVNYLIEIKEKFYCYKLRYDALINDYNPYPGFERIYHYFELFFNKLNIVYEDSDSDCDSDSDREEFDLSYTESDWEDFWNQF